MPVTGVKLKDRQDDLVQKHLEARGRADSLSVGGGVSMWPQMDDMRLTKQEAVHLAGVALGLLLGTLGLYTYLHGRWAVPKH